MRAEELAGVGLEAVTAVPQPRHHAAEIASQQLRVVWGYCREGSDTPPLWPFLRVVRDFGG